MAKTNAVQVTFTEVEELPPVPKVEPSFEAKIDAYAKMKDDLAKSARQVLVDAAKQFFDVVPIATSIQWSQYTPYFNDGEACVFRKNEPYVISNLKDPEEEDTLIDEEYEDYGYGDETWFYNITSLSWYEEQAGKKSDDSYYSTRVREVRKQLADANISEDDIANWVAAWKKFETVFNALDDDFFLDAFEDHMLVKLKRDGTVETREYSHD